VKGNIGTCNKTISVKVLCLAGFKEDVGLIYEKNAAPSACQGKVELQATFYDIGSGAQVPCDV
jgi:hypothetical protein